MTGWQVNWNEVWNSHGVTQILRTQLTVGHRRKSHTQKKKISQDTVWQLRFEPVSPEQKSSVSQPTSLYYWDMPNGFTSSSHDFPSKHRPLNISKMRFKSPCNWRSYSQSVPINNGPAIVSWCFPLSETATLLTYQVFSNVTLYLRINISRRFDRPQWFHPQGQTGLVQGDPTTLPWTPRHYDLTLRR